MPECQIYKRIMHLNEPGYTRVCIKGKGTRRSLIIPYFFYFYIATHHQNILEFLFFFDHPFLYLPFFERFFATHEPKGFYPKGLIPMNQRVFIQRFWYPWTKGFLSKGFDTHDPKGFYPKGLIPMIQKVLISTNQRFCVKGGRSPLHAKMCAIIDIQKWVGYCVIG